MLLRPASADDQDALLEALALAADWRPGTVVRAPAEVLGDPALAHYVSGWPGPQDRGVLAVVDEVAVGAAWWRFLPADDPGYGFVSSDVPEVSVGVQPAHRGQGTGTALLRALVAAAAGDGLVGLSLSVERDNPALALYRRLGFVEVGGGDGAATMLLRMPVKGL